jgi:ABC-type multidrug transport system ATPase subunit
MVNSIEAAALAKQYGSQQVLQDVSLSVPAGQVVILLGGNGAGKTVLLKLLAGLLVPDGGSVRLGGYDLEQDRPQALPQVAVFLDELQQLDEERRVGDGLPSLEGPAEPFLRTLGLEAYGDHRTGALSQGLHRQVALAHVLASDRPILLLDEPLRGLDPNAADAIRAWVQHLARTQDKAVVIATSDPRLTLGLGDRLVLLRNGHVVGDRPLDRSPHLDQPAYYNLLVRGHLDARWSAWFDGLRVSVCGNETVISGLVMDQPALHSLLVRVRDLGLLLLSVQRFDAGMEDMLHD